MNLETRSSQSLQASQGKLVGYAAVFNQPSHDLGGFREIIRPGAFKSALADASQVRALYNHNADQVLGRVGANTLRLSEDAIGLRFEIDLPPTSYAKDLSALVERGDVSGCSFAFRVRGDGERWMNQSGETIRELLDIDLSEITITANPAYPATTVATRSMAQFMKSCDMNSLWMETV